MNELAYDIMSQGPWALALWGVLHYELGRLRDAIKGLSEVDRGLERDISALRADVDRHHPPGA